MSRIRDFATALAFAQHARHTILLARAAAVSSQANALPQSVLRLLS